MAALKETIQGPDRLVTLTDWLKTGPKACFVNANYFLFEIAIRKAIRNSLTSIQERTRVYSIRRSGHFSNAHLFGYLDSASH